MQKQKTSQYLRLFLLWPAILLVCAAFSACNKSDQGIDTSVFVGNWYLTSYMEDVNGNRTNDDEKMPLQSYESCLLSFKKDGTLQVHSQRDPSNTYDLTYTWSVVSSPDVTLHLTETSTSGEKYTIAVAAISNNTLVLVHDSYNTVQSLQYSPPHSYSNNWLIFTKQF